MTTSRLPTGALNLPMGVVALILIVGMGASCCAIRQVRISRIERQARESDCFPIDVPAPFVYKVNKELTRRIIEEKQPQPADIAKMPHYLLAEDSYLTRLKFEPAGKPGQARAVRSEKCASVEMALRTNSESKSLTLLKGDRAVVVENSGEALVPYLSPTTAVRFSITPVSRPGGPSFRGWPLLEEIGLSKEEYKLLSEPLSHRAVDSHAVFNPLAGEKIEFYQARRESVTCGGKELECARLNYAANVVVKNVSHVMEGTVWLAPRVGVVKEERNVTFKVYPELLPEVEAKKRQQYPTGLVVMYQSHVTKLLAGPEGR